MYLKKKIIVFLTNDVNFEPPGPVFFIPECDLLFSHGTAPM